MFTIKLKLIPLYLQYRMESFAYRNQSATQIIKNNSKKTAPIRYILLQKVIERKANKE